MDTSLLSIIEEMQIKTTMRPDITPAGIFKKYQVRISKDLEKNKSLYSISRKIAWCRYFGEQNRTPTPPQKIQTYSSSFKFGYICKITEIQTSSSLSCSLP